MTRRRLLASTGSVLAALLLLLASPGRSAAQTVLVRVFEDAASRPIVGAIAYLVDGAGETAKSALTDDLGRALFIGIAPGPYRVRVEMIGMATAETDTFDIGVGITVSKDVRLASSAIQLEGLAVELESDRCSVRPNGEGLLVADIWDEARKALSAAALTDQRGLYRYETMRYDRRLDRGSGVILSEEQKRRDGYMRTPFESRPAEDLAMNGFVQRDGREFVYFAPDATVLLSDPFLDAHCFRMASSRNDLGHVGLEFEPTGDDKGAPDIRGTMWLDPETAELQWLEFEYTYLASEMTSPEVGGRVDFQRMPDGTWIVPEWWIRMPIMSSQVNLDGRNREYIAQYHQTGGLVLAAHEAGGRSLGQQAETGGIEGLVTDSLGVPMRGVRVGVVGSNQEVFSNTDGEFSITGLTAGKYQVRFVDARLEGLGYIPEPVTRDVIRGEMTYVEYHTPSVGDVLFESCRDVPRDQGSVLLAGTVVDELGEVVPEATVRVRWGSYSIAGGGDLILNSGNLAGVSGIRELSDGYETSASSTGSFRFCGVPPRTDLELTAMWGDRESETVRLQISDHDTGALRVLTIGPR